MIDDLSVVFFFFFFKCRFLPAEETTLYFSIQMKNVRMSDCALFNMLSTLLFVFDWKINVFAICVQGDRKILMEACSPERAQEIIHSFYTLSLLPKCSFNGKVKWHSLNMKAE